MVWMGKKPKQKKSCQNESKKEIDVGTNPETIDLS